MRRPREIIIALGTLMVLGSLAPAPAVAARSSVEEIAKAVLPTETTSTTTSGSQHTSEDVSSSQVSAQEEPSTTASSSTTAPATSGTSTSTTTTTTTTTTESALAPAVTSSSSQRPSSAGRERSGTQTKRLPTTTTTATSKTRTSSSTSARSRRRAAAPPPEAFGRQAPLPFTLRAPISGVPALFIETLDVPPFLLPIYQAAGIAYDVPWEVLAAINEVETDYGNDLAVSSAGAEGWMQFLPDEWSAYGVDVTGSGWSDPYNPADAIFAAARYLQAAGGSSHMRAAVFAYNHSQAYVEAVMLRARLLESMPPDLLGAVTNVAEARFPVHARSHFSDGFAAPAAGAEATTPLVGTTIYSEAEAPVIAVKDGTITAIGRSPSLGLHVTLRDADGNSYTYAELGSVASFYPSLRPRAELAARSTQLATAARPRGPASAGAQARSPVSASAVTQGLALGADGALQGAGGSASPLQTRSAGPSRPAGAPASRTFRAGAEQVQLLELRAGAHVIAGTVLGHLSADAAPHVLFQIKPAGVEAPLIDPKPVLDAWVELEDSGVFDANGEDPFLATSPTAGQALFESAGTLGQQILRDASIHLETCERHAIRSGKVDRAALASIELLTLSGLAPTVEHLGCDVPAAGGLGGYRRGDAYDITAINGLSIADHQRPGGVVDATERRLMTLQGTLEPRQIAGPIEYPGAARTVVLPASATLVHVSFSLAADPTGKIASVRSELTAEDWTALTERLATIPDVTVPTRRSSAAVPDAEEGAASGKEGVAEATAGEEEAPGGVEEATVGEEEGTAGEEEGAPR
jgi:Transglycosylase SLT domain